MEYFEFSILGFLTFGMLARTCTYSRCPTPTQVWVTPKQRAESVPPDPCSAKKRAHRGQRLVLATMIVPRVSPMLSIASRISRAIPPTAVNVRGKSKTARQYEILAGGLTVY